MGFLRRRTSPESELARRKAFLEEKFGEDVSAKLIDHLGVEGAAAFAESTVAEAQARWSHRNDEDFLTEEEREEMHQKGGESGADTIKTRAAFFTLFMAKKVAGEVASEAMNKANLPEDRELHLDVAEGIYRSLD